MDWGYVAGYFDGEGMVHFKAHPSRPNYVICSLSWHNTHLESLEAIKDFIGCGTVGDGKVRKIGTKPMYRLEVNRVNDVLRVGEVMLPHLIVKRDKLLDMMNFARENRKPQSVNWGALAAVGEDEIKRLYWDEGLTQKQISEMLGLHRGAVATFMSRKGIKGRKSGPRPKEVPVKEKAPKIDKVAEISTEQFIQWYHGEGKSYAAIAKMLKVAPIAIMKAFRARGIEGRPVGGAFMKGVPKSEETHQRMLDTRRKMWEDPEFRASQLQNLAKGREARKKNQSDQRTAP